VGVKRIDNRELFQQPAELSVGNRGEPKRTTL
jgi:hypothetical protein